MMERRRKKKKVAASKVLFWSFLVLILGSMMVSFIQNQVEISSKKQELEAVQEQLDAQLAQNTELSRILEEGTEQEIIERIARDQLGYAKPGERVFVDTSGK